MDIEGARGRKREEEGVVQEDVDPQGTEWRANEEVRRALAPGFFNCNSNCDFLAGGMN
jgi:hypothetical protein